MEKLKPKKKQIKNERIIKIMKTNLKNKINKNMNI